MFLRVFEASCKLVLNQFKECFRRVSRKFLVFHGSFKSASKKFKGSVMEIWSFNRVSMIFHRSFKEVSRKFLKCLIEV